MIFFEVAALQQGYSIIFDLFHRFRMASLAIIALHYGPNSVACMNLGEKLW